MIALPARPLITYKALGSSKGKMSEEQMARLPAPDPNLPAKGQAVSLAAVRVTKAGKPRPFRSCSPIFQITHTSSDRSTEDLLIHEGNPSGNRSCLVGRHQILHIAARRSRAFTSGSSPGTALKGVPKENQHINLPLGNDSPQTADRHPWGPENRQVIQLASAHNCTRGSRGVEMM